MLDQDRPDPRFEEGEAVGEHLDGSRQAVLRLGRALYPFLQAELFLPWDEDGFAERIERTIAMFVREGLLRQRWVTKGEVSDSLLFGLLRGEARP